VKVGEAEIFDYSSGPRNRLCSAIDGDFARVGRAANDDAMLTAYPAVSSFHQIRAARCLALKALVLGDDLHAPISWEGSCKFGAAGIDGEGLTVFVLRGFATTR